MILDERQLAEKVTRREVGQWLVGRHAFVDADLAARDHVQRRRRRVLADDDVPGLVGALLPLFGEALDRPAVEARQQRDRRECLFEFQASLLR
jgi:hypothetical protein